MRRMRGRKLQAEIESRRVSIKEQTMGREKKSQALSRGVPAGSKTWLVEILFS